MAKRKVKVTSVLDLSEKEVEVDDSGKILVNPTPEDEQKWRELDMQARIEPAPASAMQCREIPEGYNKYTPTNEWLMLILESLYRIEAKMGA